MNKSPLPNIDELLQRLLDDQIKPAEMERLQEALREDPQVRNYYIDSMLVSAVNRQISLTPQSIWAEQERVREVERYARQQLEAFLEQERPKSAPQPVSEPQWDLIDIAQDLLQTVHRWIRIAIRTLKIGFVCGILILAGLIIAGVIKDHMNIALLQGTVNAQWQTAPEKSELRRGWMALKEGCAEIAFKQGAHVIIQAPCRFRLVSPGRMYLKTGTVTAHVPPEAIGFTTETPSSIFEDFGTDFGVIVDASSQSEVHVFNGEIGVASSMQERSLSQNRLKQGQCAITDLTGAVYIDQSHYGARQFLRELPDPNGIGIPGKRLSLADLVGGGNGYGTGILGSSLLSAEGSINPITGRPNDPSRPETPYQLENDRVPSDDYDRYDYYHYQCSNDYIRVPEMPYIDGVFVPDGSQGPSVVSSAGHIFHGCPDTDGLVKWNVVNGWRYRALKDFATNSHVQAPGLSLTANIGITFDLNAIRRTMPGSMITAFHSTAGIPIAPKPNLGEIDLWVLVDGDVRFVQQDVRYPTMAPIRVPLNSQDHFLTLIVTDSQTPKPAKYYSSFDWCFWREPVLELAPSQSVSSR